MTTPNSDPDSDQPLQLQPHRDASRRTWWCSPHRQSRQSGGRGRPSRRLIIRASKDLERELARLKQIAESAHEVTCPQCQHTFTPKPTARMDSRDRIAYARLLAEAREG
jgi:hypothetical protein